MAYTFSRYCTGGDDGVVVVIDIKVCPFLTTRLFF